MFHYQKYKSTDKQYYQAFLVLRNDLLWTPIGKFIDADGLMLERKNNFYGVSKIVKLIGTLSFFEDEPRDCSLNSIRNSWGVSKKWFRYSLVKFLVADLRERGYLKVHVDARAEAKIFYQKCGFFSYWETNFE